MGLYLWFIFSFFSFSKGFVSLQIGHLKDFVYGMALQKDEKILLAGASHNGTDLDIFLARLLYNGKLDPTFGQSGVSIFDSRLGDDKAYAVQVDRDGYIFVAGCTFNGNDTDFALMKFNPSGQLDTSFGKNGITTHDFGPGNDCAFNLYLEKNKKITIVGTVNNGKTQDFAIARFLPDGTPDIQFGHNGGNSRDFLFDGGQAGNETAYNLVRNPETGDYWVSGYSELSNQTAFTLLKFDRDGMFPEAESKLKSKTERSLVVDDFGEARDKAFSVAAWGKNKFVAAGSATREGIDHFAFSRHSFTGDPDVTFGRGGKVLLPAGSKGGAIYAVINDQDERIVAAGQSLSMDQNQMTAVVLKPTGQIIPTFGDKGTAHVKLPTIDAGAYAALLDSDHKIVLGGYMAQDDQYVISVVRLMPNGQLDPTFGESETSIKYVFERHRRQSIAAEVGLPSLLKLLPSFLHKSQ